eukprot:jgi/Ulvmu1/7200/UM034_0109.1
MTLRKQISWFAFTEPVAFWSLILGSSCIVLPLVAKPAREALGFTPHAEVRQPPHPRQVVENALSKEG